MNFYLNESVSGTITFTAKTATNDNPFSSIDVGLDSSPTFVDVNGDSKIDLVVGESAGNLNYYLNESANNTITFTSKTGENNPFNGFDVGFGATPTFAYINNDNKIDLIVGNNIGTLAYYLNESANNTTTFTLKTSNDNPFNGVNVGTYSKPVFTNISDDNKIDLVVGESDGTLNYYLNETTDSTIAFTNKTEIYNPFHDINKAVKNRRYSTPALVDINRDNKVDLVLGEQNKKLRFYLNESTVNSVVFTEQTQTNNPFNALNAETKPSPVFADINGDNKLDLVMGLHDGTLKFHLNESTQDVTTFTLKTGTENPFNGFDVGGLCKPGIC